MRRGQSDRFTLSFIRPWPPATAVTRRGESDRFTLNFTRP